MEHAPQVTVLTPVRDYRDDYLRAAVDSLLGQSSPDWRLLIVADGPRRDELAAALGERSDEPRIALLENGGRKLAGALNTGMRAASTPFAAILFADDLWDEQAVAVLTREIAAHPDVDFFHSARRFVAEDGTPTSSTYPSQSDVTLADFGPASPGKVAPIRHLMCWRISTALAFGGMDERLNSIGVDDFDFPWTMAEHGATFRAVPECLYVIRDHRSHFRLTTHVPLKVHMREVRRIMRKHGVPRADVDRFLAEARGGYLRQCLYRSRADRWIKERLRVGRVEPWYEPYS